MGSLVHLISHNSFTHPFIPLSAASLPCGGHTQQLSVHQAYTLAYSWCQSSLLEAQIWLLKGTCSPGFHCGLKDHTVAQLYASASSSSRIHYWSLIKKSSNLNWHWSFKVWQLQKNLVYHLPGGGEKCPLLKRHSAVQLGSFLVSKKMKAR